MDPGDLVAGGVKVTRRRHTAESTDRPSPVTAPKPETARVSDETSDSFPGASSSSFVLGGVPNGETPPPGCNPAPAIARISGDAPRPTKVLDQSTKALLPSKTLVPRADVAFTQSVSPPGRGEESRYRGLSTPAADCRICLSDSGVPKQNYLVNVHDVLLVSSCGSDSLCQRYHFSSRHFMWQ